MAPQTGTALVVLVAFVLPGFITVLIQERTYKSAEDPTPFDRLLRAVYYSVWSYLLLALVALLLGVDREYVVGTFEHFKDDPAELVWRGALLALAPAVVVANAARYWSGSGLQRRALTKLRINVRHEVPTAWDHFFRQRRESYVRVTMSDGIRLLGFYGEDSFAAYAKDGRDLYLESVYVIDEDNDWFGAAVEGSRGVWLDTEDLVSIEFYDPVYAAAETAPTTAEASNGEERRASGPRRERQAAPAASPSSEAP